MPLKKTQTEFMLSIFHERTEAAHSAQDKAAVLPDRFFLRVSGK